MGSDYSIEPAGTDRELHQSTFDASDYLSQTATCTYEHIQQQLKDKENQIEGRIELYKEQVDRLWNRIDNRADELEALQNRMARKEEEKQRLEQKLTDRYRDLHQLQQGFLHDLWELEDKRTALQQELENADHGWELVALAEDWMDSV